MKKRIVRSGNTKNFLAAASQTIPVVAQFGENFISCLFDGEIVSSDEVLSEVADVLVEKICLGVQVKMCNGRHASRPTVSQVEALYKEVHDEATFLVDIQHGLYAFVFYIGVQNDPKRKGKSKILSRKNSKADKLEIIAKDLQFVYLVDVDLLHHLVTSGDFPEVQKAGSCKVHAKRKINSYKDRMVLYLNRTFLGGFMVENIADKLRELLNQSIGKGIWLIKEREVKMHFVGNSGAFGREIPIRFIGRRTTGEILEKQIKTTISLDIRTTDNQFKL